MKFSSLALAAAVLCTALIPAAQAQSLAGDRGDVRYPVSRVNVEGACPKAFARYVASAHHAAYAQTHLGGTYNYFCGASLRAPSKAAAEKQALANCNAAGKKYKLPVTGKCTIYASK